MNWPEDYINKVICGDCLEVMKGIPDGVIDLVLTDPPYGLDIAKGGTLNVNSNAPYKPSDWDKNIPPDEVFLEIFRVSQQQTIWGGNYFPFLWQNSCRGFLYWNKHNHSSNRADGEMAWTSIDGCSRHFDYMWDGNRYGFPNTKIKGVGLKTFRTHPTQKPVELMNWVLGLHSNSGDIILDPFAGSGTTLVACKQLGRKYIGIEIGQKYCDIAEDRLRQEELF